MSALPPGATIGILGGGQLGRMLALAAAELGFDTHVFTDEPDSPAARVSTAATVAAYDNEAALAAFAASVDAVTFEFENIPAATGEALLRAGKPVRPGPDCLAVAQDRLSEKRFFVEAGAPVGAYVAIDHLDQIGPALAELGGEAVLKTRRMGYDGKGQAWLRGAADAAGAWAAIGAAPAILEAKVPFVREVSVVAALGLDGSFAAYDLNENVHQAGILARTTVPASVSAATAKAAIAYTRAIMDRLDYVGVLAIEFFELADGALLTNEMAPRVHNSGHWTLDACAVSQFEQQIRAVAGWPLGDPARFCDVTMHNLLGEAAADWHALAQKPSSKLHLYGKRDARPGRKMGHFTELKPWPRG
jgi:5-(carboxyamino)imidazole ribonucleotide synthase